MTKKTILHFKEGTSDKVYEAWLELTPSGKQAKVCFAYGRRGGNLKTGTKTPRAVALDKAKETLKSLVAEKKKKGYKSKGSSKSKAVKGNVKKKRVGSPKKSSRPKSSKTPRRTRYPKCMKIGRNKFWAARILIEQNDLWGGGDAGEGDGYSISVGDMFEESEVLLRDFGITEYSWIESELKKTWDAQINPSENYFVFEPEVLFDEVRKNGISKYSMSYGFKKLRSHLKECNTLDKLFWVECSKADDLGIFLEDFGINECEIRRGDPDFYWSDGVLECSNNDEYTEYTELSLNDTQRRIGRITAEVLKEKVWGLQLTALSLCDTVITDAGFKEVAKLQKLKVLRLESTKVTNTRLKEVAKLKQLTELDLSKTKITDAGLREVAKIKKLKVLALRGNKITDAGLKEVAKMQQLTELDLTGTQITDVGLKEVAKIQQLTELHLSGTKITDKGFKEVAKLKKLNGLTLQNTKITDAGLKELVKCKNLNDLLLWSTKVTKAGVTQLQRALPKCRITSDFETGWNNKRKKGRPKAAKKE